MSGANQKYKPNILANVPPNQQDHVQQQFNNCTLLFQMQLEETDDVKEALKAVFAIALHIGRGLPELENPESSFNRGVKHGQRQTLEKITQLHEKQIAAARLKAFEEGANVGSELERKSWLSSGHLADGHCSPSKQMSSIALQTEPPPTDITPTVSWSEDADTHIPIRMPPRDLSSLSSGKKNPFSSIHRRTIRISQPKRSRPHHWPSSTLQSRHHRHTTVTAPPSDREWRSDPRLRALSHALEDLGWVRSKHRRPRRHKSVVPPDPQPPESPFLPWLKLDPQLEVEA